MCKSAFFGLWFGFKTSELRLDDRRFEVGDYLEILEYDVEKDVYSGRFIEAKISHILREHLGIVRGM